jgi:cytoskeletal protein CcmA (bactofilin family)
LGQQPANEISDWEVIENSFADSTIVLTDFEEIYLEEVILKGNILISSDTLVEIHPTAVLEDVIVKAPVIRVKKGANISAQLLAADTLIIEEDCVLHYPSIIAVRSEQRGFITIAGNTKVYGDLWYKSGKDPGSTSIDVHIDKEAGITGRLMVERGNLQLRGKVRGEVYAEDFILHHPVGIYKNHLLSVQIDRRALWEPYLFPVKAREKDKANVIKWL